LTENDRMTDTAPDTAAESTPRLSIVVPALNEAANIGPLVDEIAAAFADFGPFEVIVVDDGSDDDMPLRLREMKGRLGWLHSIRHRQRSGQSAAVVTGVAASRAPVVATIDGDGQNVPDDIRKLFDAYEAGRNETPFMVCGRRAKRRDSALKLISSRIANAVRSRILGDATPDTGCGLKVFARADFMALPHFDHMHRFLPALMLRAGGRIVSVDVRHRPRQGGVSKYGMWNRLWIGIVDLFGVSWLMRRRLPPLSTIAAGGPGDD
jgi:dolichol-phosphate mannosyltransferase